MATTRTWCRATGLIGVLAGAPLIMLVTSSTALATPDELDTSPLYLTTDKSYAGGLVQDMQYPFAGEFGDSTLGNWNSSRETALGLHSATTDINYEYYAGGEDTGNTVKQDINLVYAGSSYGANELWGNTFTEEVNSHGVVIGMEDIVDIGGHNFTLFDNIPDSLATVEFYPFEL